MANSMVIEAVFENGVFRPSSPVSLPSPQVVTLLVQMPSRARKRMARRRGADLPGNRRRRSSPRQCHVGGREINLARRREQR